MKLYKDGLWPRIKFTLLGPSEWGFKYETTNHCKCKQIKALGVLVTFADLKCYTQAMSKILSALLTGSYSDKSTNKDTSDESVGGIRLEFEE